MQLHTTRTVKILTEAGAGKAYWMLPTGEIVPVPFQEHTQYVSANPSKFKLTSKQQADISFFEDEDDSDAGTKYNAILDAALSNGAIRIFEDYASKTYFIEYATLSNLKKQAYALHKFLVDEDPDAQITAFDWKQSKETIRNKSADLLKRI
jgi:hypothetical protein